MEGDDVSNNKNNDDGSDNGNGIVVSDSAGGGGGGFPGFCAKRSIAERRGFNSNAARINTALFRTTSTSSPTTSPLPSPAARSPRLTIPPGISPTALLDSPIMLPNSQGMQSPTTGTFLLVPSLTDNEGSMLSSVTLEQRDMVSATDASPSFKFKARADPNPLPPHSASVNQVSSNCHMVKGGNADCKLVQVQPPLDFSFPADFPQVHTTKNSEVHSYNDVKMVNETIISANVVEMPITRSEEASDESSLPKSAIHGEDIERHHFLEGDQKETSHATGMVRTSEDGYNWRKYGQKQVKGSEYPRSYYKCTHPSCQVKKKVERSHDGQITEIIYKGAHNHAKPHPSRRASSLSTDEMSDMGEASGTCAKVDGGLVWRNIQSGEKDAKHSLDWKADGQERTSSTSVVTELSDPISSNKAKSLCMFESDDNPELSSTLASHDGYEDGATQAGISLEDDADDEESESKRRKKENSLIESNLPSRALREPRVVVQIESEVDILDDGYRWRKYGQKVVKGNPNPRSYYKCTNAGCSVRKHVERASHNLKYVITTYEGKHNHEVPTARNNNQISSSGGGVPPSATNAQVALTFPGNATIPKPEPQVQTLAPHFDRKPEFSNKFLRPSLVENFSNDMKFGPSSICQMKYSSLNNTMPYGCYGLNPDRCAIPQAGSISSMFPDFPISLPLNIPSPGNFSLAGLNFNCVKSMGPVQSFLSGQQVKEIDSGFLRPKQEQKDDNIYGVDHPNASLTASSAPSSIYQRVLQNFPS